MFSVLRGGQVLLSPREGRGGNVDCSALTLGAGGTYRQARAWALRLALTLVVGVIFAVGSSKEAYAVSDEGYFPFGSSFCVGEGSSTYQASNGFLYGESVTRPLAYGYFYGPCSFAVTK